MEILFFRIGNLIAGIQTKFIQKVVFAPELRPFLPVSPVIKNMLIDQGRPVGLIELDKLISNQENDTNNIVIILEFNDIKFGILVKKILQTRAVSSKKLVPPDRIRQGIKNYTESLCQVRKTYIPVLSPEKILLYEDIRKLWFKEE
ncbi:chemotaxis protein CheW [candidate division KSB1 bacterium]